MMTGLVEGIQNKTNRLITKRHRDIFQAHSERHGYLVQNTGNAANGSREADGSASKGHQTDEQGIGVGVGVRVRVRVVIKRI